MASFEAVLVAWIKAGWTVSGLEHTLVLLNTTNLGFTVLLINPRYSESLLHFKANLNILAPQRSNIGIFYDENQTSLESLNPILDTKISVLPSCSWNTPCILKWVELESSGQIL